MTIARRFALPLAVSFSVLALAACGGAKDEDKAAPTAAPEAKPGIAVSNGKMILPAVSGNPGGVYFTLENSGTNTVSIA